MKSFRSNNRGQFVVAAALLIAILTFSYALSIHQVNLNRQQLMYEPVEELVLGVTSDLDRCLLQALSIASQRYYETGLKQSATREGYDFISRWVRSVLTSYGHLGVKMSMSVPNMAEGGLTDVSWSLDWNREVGLSQVYTKFDLDVDAYGFRGWVGHSGSFVMLRIYPETITLATQSTTLIFQVMQGRDEAAPIPNLTPENLKIYVHLTGKGLAPAEVTALNYLGGGNYSVNFEPRINEHTFVELTVVTPEDGIYVSAFYYKDIFVKLNSLEQSLDSENLGQIQIGNYVHTLPHSKKISPGTYILRYFAEDGYRFLNWTTSGFATVNNSDSSITSVTIDGNGTVTAFYERYTSPEPEIGHLILDSRQQNNLTSSLGNITLNSTENTLPANVSIATGDYALEYHTHNSSYIFLWWETSGDVIPWNPYNNSTMLTVEGNGTITAVYGTEPPTTTPVTVSLQSKERTLASNNLGETQLGETLYTLPNSTTIYNGTYLLKYVAAEGYTFINWTTTGDINVQDPYSSTTSVDLNNNGTITAFYRGCEVLLNSRHWANLAFNLGNITLDMETYSLPKNVTGLAQGDYFLQYTPYNASYVFLWWEFSGEVIPWNGSQTTTLTLYGDGAVTAVFGQHQPPPVGDWDTLYVDSRYKIVPPFMWSLKNGKLPPSFSTGNEKQVCVLYSPLTPTIYLSNLVNVTAYLRINPPENAKNVTMELGFVYDGEYNVLGDGAFGVAEQGVYFLMINITETPSPYGNIIPEGSSITLTITVTFFKEPWGTFFLYHGPSRPSHIQLY